MLLTVLVLPFFLFQKFERFFENRHVTFMVGLTILRFKLVTLNA